MAQSLPYTQSFAGLAHSGTTYPAGWQGWQLSTAGPLTNFRVTAPTANLNLTANSTAATNSGGVHNYNGKIGLLQSGTNDPAIALAINTTGLSSVKVSYDIMTIRNPYDGSTNTRISEATLQYRVGTSGNFTTLSGIEYQNITTTQTTAVTTPQNLQNKSITLPSACDNNAVVQLRWVARDGTGSGARPSFAIDNVAICTPPPCSISGADYVCNNTPGNIYMAPAGMASYSWGISGNGSIPGSTTGQSVSVTSGNYLNSYTVAVTITDANGCASSCSRLSDIFLFTPPANITVNPNPACFGVTLNLSIPHTYGVTVTADNGCSNTGTASVNVNPLPAAPNCPTSSSTCLNTPAYALTGGSPGSGVYSGPGVSAGMFNPASAGPGAHTITYTVTDGNSCTNTCTFTITVHPTPACSITFANPPPGGLDEACANSTGNVYSAPAGMNSYNWSISGSGTITSATTGSSVTVTAGNSGSYNLYLTVTDDNGCSSACSDETPIKPSPTCSLSGPDPVCANSTGNVYSVSNGSFTISSYSWSISGDGVITSATNGSSITVTAGASGAYTVNVTSVGFNACPSNCSQMVTINSASTPAITGPASVCSGSNVILDAGAGYSSYAWSNGGGSGQTATFNNVTSTTTYSVTVTNSGCTGTDTHEVVVQSCIADFSGKIIFSNNNSLGVNNATVSLSGSATDSDVSDINGDFFVSSGIPSGSFTLKPTKTINKLNGVTVADVTAIQQHISNSVPINDLYKLVAADVNKTNSINSLDVTVVNQSLLGNPAALAQFKTSWRFVPTSHTMTNPPWGFPEQRNYTNINTSKSTRIFTA
ncbi:MAG: hypothetical protein IPJ82_05315 [Lewinellaceae bacterium]|nr:hypothetical protein [Lewinellaceae bacterium]